MSNPKGKTLPNAVSMFLVMFAVYSIDIFLFRSDLTVLGDAFASRFISLAILFLYVWAAKDSFTTLGISKKSNKFLAGALYGSVFSLIPLLLVSVGECIYYASTDINALSLGFETPNMSYVRSEENLTPVAGVAIYIFTCFFGNAFKEIFFRGFLLKKFNKIMDFAKANLFQAVLYMAFIIPYLARNIPDQLNRNKLSVPLAVFMIVFYIVHETIAGIKWGLMTRVSGSVYMAITDHFLFVFFSNSLFITNRYVTWSFMLHMMAIQLVSLLLVLIYYFDAMKKIKAKKEKEKAKISAELKEIEERRKEKEANHKVRKKLDNVDEISPRSFKNIVMESEKQKRKAVSDEDALENKIVLETALKEDVSHDNDESVDAILKKVNREMRRRENPVSSSEITSDFDSDSFLEAYTRQDGSHLKSHSHSHRHHHHHHHYKEKVAQAEEKTYMPQTKDKLAKKPKRTFAQKIQSLGGVDDSSANDLI